jgi:TfoX/Sxy family transcriptional regulator of competence genes
MTNRSDARGAGNELLHTLVATLPPEWRVEINRMFSGQGLEVDGRFFAFVDKNGRLVVKLSQRDVVRLVDEGQAELVTMGKRTMREWAGLTQPEDGDLDRWRAAAEAAYSFLRRSGGDPD